MALREVLLTGMAPEGRNRSTVQVQLKGSGQKGDYNVSRHMTFDNVRPVD